MGYRDQCAAALMMITAVALAMGSAASAEVTPALSRRVFLRGDPGAAALQDQDA